VSWGPHAARDLVARARVLISVGTPRIVEPTEYIPQPTIATVLDVRPAAGRIEVLTDHGLRLLDPNASVWALLPVTVEIVDEEGARAPEAEFDPLWYPAAGQEVAPFVATTDHVEHARACLAVMREAESTDDKEPA
jgi:hypothetical protein